MPYKTSTNVSKCPHRKSWGAESSVDLGLNLVLRINTRKTSSGQLCTTATRGVLSNDGHGFTFYPYSDFNETVRRADVRVTEKAVREQHEGVLANLESLVKSCEEHYSTGKGNE